VNTAEWMPAAWPVLVVDDDPAVLQLSSLMLAGMQVDGRPLQVDCCDSAASARVRLSSQRYAVAVIDVVMETEHAGLDLVEHMRADCRHSITPIVVRTGQPGSFPEARVLQEFRISDYWQKNDLRPARVRTAVTGLIRAFETACSLEQLANERGVLLREIHHRVKNNLQTVSSLLNLQRDDLESAQARRLLDDSVARVRSMALVHEKLYGMDTLDVIEFTDYTRVLASSLSALMAPAVRVSVTGETVGLSIDLALPMGLILTELLTNAFKYGCPGGAADPARVDIAIRREEGGFLLRVCDQGPGLPEAFDIRRGRTLGWQLVNSLLRQVRGTIEVSRGPGACFEVRCPLIP
jgi:two-component sensor histidine kinase